MKQKLVALTGSLLTACMAFSWWFGGDVISLLLLGEYSYPVEKKD